SPLEVPFFVEYPIVRQICLAIDVYQLAVSNYCRRIVDVRSIGVHEPDYSDQAFRRSDYSLQRLPVVFDELGFQKQVFGRVSRYGQFRSSHDVSTSMPGAVDILDDQRRVSLQVTDCRVDLSQRYTDRFHITTIND